MVSTCVDPVLHDLESLRPHYGICILFLQREFRLLRTFLLSVRKWGNNDVYFECNDKRIVSLRSLVSSTEDIVKKYAVDIHSLCLRKQSELGHLLDEDTVKKYAVDILCHGKQSESGSLEAIHDKYKESIWSLKLDITKTYTDLLDCSLQSGPCMRDDELVELVDSLIQNLVNLPRGGFNISLRAQVELELFQVKLIFLKNVVRFSILRGVELGQLEDLLTRFHVVALNAACLCYMCDAIEDPARIRSLISEQIPKIEPFDLHLFETCIKILRACISPSNLQSVARDEHIMREFNDSLMHSLLEIRCSFVFMDCVKDQVEILYTGLKFLRNILREPQEKMDRLNEKIGALISEAGVIICSLSVNQVKEGEVNSLEVRDMLINTNRGIKLIKDQISGSSMTGGLPSYRSFKGHQVANSYSLVPSKRKITVTQEVVVGFDDEAKTIVNRLLRGSRQLEVIPIVGMPGIGKTTLAKKVNKNASVMSHFHIRLWCCVSQVYDRKNLMLQLLCDDNKYSGMNDDDLLQRLYQMLKETKYLIVFDDVWDIGFWNDLRLSFPNDENGSRILFTSRFSDVASQVEFGKEPHNLRSLTERESWELLQKMVFGNEDFPQELRILGKEIAKNCRGLPLTIVIIAGVLATIEHDGWEDVANSLASTIVCDTDLCKNTLQMSYEHLPHYLKPCFLYFGAFPEDQEIETEKLMWLWIAEGFVQNTEPRRLEDVAEDYMMDLIGRNLVMVSKEKSTGAVKACHIHDLLREFCKSRAKEENFLLMLQGRDDLYTFIEPPDLQRLSIFSTQEDFMKSSIFCSNLSSLLLFKQGASCGVLRAAVILFICCFYKHLRVLDLAAFTVLYRDFPVEINVLVQLRYLAIGGTIKVIPPSVANLSNLETFLVKSHCCVSLPETIWNLKKLRHLHIEPSCGRCLPDGSVDNASSLHNLDTFSCLKVSSGKSLAEIVKKIPNVRKLKISLSPVRFPFLHAMKSTGYCTLSLDSLNQLESLESLKVRSDYKFCDDLQFCFSSTLKNLTLGYLYLPWSKISLVEELPNLDVLKLLSKSFEGKRWDMKEGGFPKLRVLHLEYLDVKEWTDTDCDGNYFPSLEKLQLVHLSKLKMVPSCLGTIPKLKTIKAKISMASLPVASFVREIEKKQKDYGNENLEMLIEYVKLKPDEMVVKKVWKPICSNRGLHNSIMA